MKSTPVSATSRTVSSVTPPDASSFGAAGAARAAAAQSRRRSCCPAGPGHARRRAPRQLVEALAPPPRRRRLRRVSPRRAAAAAPTPPAIRAWFSFTRIASWRPARWETPPPASTAAFSSSRRPGVVLRVSRIRVPVPCDRSHVARGRVATPDSRPSRFRATRSAARMPAARPSIPPPRPPRASCPPRHAARSAAGVDLPEGLPRGLEARDHAGLALLDARPRPRAARAPRPRRW